MTKELTYEQETVRSVFGAYINDLKAYSSKPDRPTFRKLEEVRDKAIKALEAQPSEDCISRQAAIEGLARIAKAKAKSDAQKSMMGRCMFFVEQLPPVTPQRTKGKWIKIQSGDKDFPESIVCSRCKNENSHLDFDEHGEPIGKVFVTSKYCPNCGSYNGGEEDEEKSL